MIVVSDGSRQGWTQNWALGGYLLHFFSFSCGKLLNTIIFYGICYHLGGGTGPLAPWIRQ